MFVDMASAREVRSVTQIDYYHHQVPHLSEIIKSRDPAQDEYLFSVSFRKYGNGNGQNRGVYNYV